VQITGRDGGQWEEFVEAATGTPGNPMSDADLVEKFLDLVADRFTAIQAKRIADQALAADELADVRKLMELLQLSQ